MRVGGNGVKRIGNGNGGFIFILLIMNHIAYSKYKSKKKNQI